MNATNAKIVSEKLFNFTSNMTEFTPYDVSMVTSVLEHLGTHMMLSTDIVNNIFAVVDHLLTVEKRVLKNAVVSDRYVLYIYCTINFFKKSKRDM